MVVPGDESGGVEEEKSSKSYNGVSGVEIGKESAFGWQPEGESMTGCGYIIGVARETSIMEDGREGASSRWKN